MRTTGIRIHRWKGAAIQRRLEHGSRGIAIVGVVTRQLPVNTLRAGKYLACALAICKVWNLVMVLKLSVPKIYVLKW
jgi:hypothetical protein